MASGVELVPALAPSGSEDSERREIAQIFEATRVVSFVGGALELDYPELGEMLHGGHVENDLMKLKIGLPDPVDPNTIVTLILSPGMTLWEEKWKGTEIPHATVGQTVHAGIPVETLPRIIWIEATQVSTSLRDFQIEAQYRKGRDRIKATAIWSEITVETATKDAAELFGTSPNFTTFNDMEEPPRAWIDGPIPGFIGGTGLRPPGAGNGVKNGIVVQWNILPYRDYNTDGTWESDGVQFDATRQVESRTFVRLLANPIWYPTNTPDNPWKWFPKNVYEGNDDRDYVEAQSPPPPFVNGTWPASDESRYPTDNQPQGSANKFYQLDGPGISGVTAPANVVQARGFGNFNEWLQVSFTQRPTADGTNGIRMSDFLEWHFMVDVTVTAGVGSAWQRNDATYNEIGIGHINIPYDL